MFVEQSYLSDNYLLHKKERRLKVFNLYGISLYCVKISREQSFVTVTSKFCLCAAFTRTWGCDAPINHLIPFAVNAFLSSVQLVVGAASDYAANTFIYLSVDARRWSKAKRRRWEMYLNLSATDIHLGTSNLCASLRWRFRNVFQSRRRDGKIIHQLVNYIQLWSTSDGGVFWFICLMSLTTFEAVFFCRLHVMIPTRFGVKKKNNFSRHFLLFELELTQQRFEKTFSNPQHSIVVFNRWRAMS